jgi:hypothetical protein
MTKQELLEYNIRIAKFLGYSKPIVDKDFYFVEYTNFKDNQLIPKMLELNFENRFYTDWNWIMWIIEKINMTTNNGTKK